MKPGYRVLRICHGRLILALAAIITVLTFQFAQAADEADRVFSDSIVQEYHLVFHQQDFWDSLVYNFEILDEEYMACDLIYEDSLFENIGIRLKGNSSYTLYPGIKKSLKLDFNRYDDDQLFFGLKKLNLHNAYKDPTIMREKLTYEFFGDFIPCSRAGFARVYINGDYWGIYTVTEQVDQTFLRANFSDDVDGNLFKGDPSGNLVWYGADPEPYYSLYELKEAETDNPWDDLIGFIDELNHMPDDSLAKVLPHAFDVRNFLTFQGMNNLLVNLDSYYGATKNYYLYGIDDGERFTHIPWDVNESFGAYTMGMPRINIIMHDLFWQFGPVGYKPLYERILWDPYFADLYLNWVDYLMQDIFTEEHMSARIDHYADLIRDAVYADTLKMFTDAEFETNLDLPVYYGEETIVGLKDLVHWRIYFVSRQMADFVPTNKICINELMASNDTTIADEVGDHDDWIEIYNENLYPVSLDGYHLTNYYAEPNQWAFPDTVIAPGEYMLVWADNEGPEGPLHAGFTLGNFGGEVALVEPGGTFVDSVSFGPLDSDWSYGRYPDGWESACVFRFPSPGEPNVDPGNRFPEIRWSRFAPYTVTDTDSVLVTAEVYDESGLAGVDIHFDAGVGYTDIAMNDDGAGSDALAGDGIWSGAIPPVENGSEVVFYIAATDDSGYVTFEPPVPGEVTFRYLVGQAPLPIFVNEFMADNGYIVADPQGDYDDWLELYNAADTAVRLSGMYLTDNLEQPEKYLIGDTSIPARGYIVFWADDDDDDGITHTSFKLGASGEQIGLFTSYQDGIHPIDTLSFGSQTTDVSFGRLWDGRRYWGVMNPSTPGSSNGTLVCGDIDNNGSGPDIGDLLFLVEYMFLNGPPPPQLEATDLDGSGGNIDVADLLYLIDYMFQQGPEPLC